ncbi:MAG: hypothetical protein WBH50_23355 [Fuerstiella sp.]
MLVPVIRSRTSALSLTLLLLANFSSGNIHSAMAADEFEKPPISYSSIAADNCVSRLQQQLEAGSKVLNHDDQHGYLSSLLTALDVPVESQMLVFSKTSLQQRRITPRTPRAIYFNENVYVGYCQSGDVLELSAVDPMLGTVFYTMDQDATVKPQLQRRNDNCLVCHSSSRTGGIPGHVVRSLYVDAGGQPLFSAGSRTVDHTTPIKERWGGWYVTGTHGEQSHVGNLIIRSNRVVEPVDNTEGQNVTDLASRFKVERYMTPHSDIVALMVLEHQTLVQNCITKANFATRQAFHDQKAMNKVLEYPEDHQLDSTARRITNSVKDLVEAVLFVDEAPLTSLISGTSGYTEMFSKSAVRDSTGRSLKDLDMNRRMFKYPCSYLIYSDAFDGLPQQTQDEFWKQLWAVLSNDNQAQEFAHLAASDRLAIAEIIQQTKPNLPDYWNPPAAARATSVDQ